MQVSWIDPQDVAALAENLRRPPPKPAAPPPLAASEPPVFADADLDTLHEAFVGMGMEDEDEAEPMVPFEESYHEEDFASEASPDDESVVHVEDSPLPNLAAFRERLQAIRERAIGAGLLPGAVSPQPASPEPESVLQSTVSQAEASRETVAENEAEAWVFDLPLGTVDERLEAFASWAYRHIGEAELLVVDDHGDLLWGRHARPELILSTLMARNAASRSSALSACGPSGTIHHKLASGYTLTVIPCGTRLGMIQVAVAAAKGVHEADADRLRQALIAAMDTQG